MKRPAMRCAAQQLTKAGPLRVVAHDVAKHQHRVSARIGRDQLAALAFGQRQRLLHQHVLPGLQTGQPDLVVQVVRHRDDQGIHMRQELAIVRGRHSIATRRISSCLRP
jgi:hypothetical protein